MLERNCAVCEVFYWCVSHRGPADVKCDTDLHQYRGSVEERYQLYEPTWIKRQDDKCLCKASTRDVGRRIPLSDADRLQSKMSRSCDRPLLILPR